jgi:hypothetical protein
MATTAYNMKVCLRMSPNLAKYSYVWSALEQLITKLIKPQTTKLGHVKVEPNPSSAYCSGPVHSTRAPKTRLSRVSGRETP